MTGQQIIDLARAHFGEATANSVSTADAVKYLNVALKELYSDLPPERMRELAQVDMVSMSLTENRGLIPNHYDRVVEVYVNDTPAVSVPREVIASSDHGRFFTSPVPIFHIDPKHLWVRPETGDVAVLHLTPPSDITASDPAPFLLVFHPAVASLVASYMYAQEEDLEQANYYRGDYLSKLANALEMAAAEAS